jgi:hypothetical protein
MIASWPARTDVPTAFVAIEFPTKEEADKFAPKLETFLPTVLPPVTETPDIPLPPEPKSNESAKAATRQDRESEAAAIAGRDFVSAGVDRATSFVITHAGNLVCISDKSFKFSKLRPKDSRPLFYDQNFRTARDQFLIRTNLLFHQRSWKIRAGVASPTPFITRRKRLG